METNVPQLNEVAYSTAELNQKHRIMSKDKTSLETQSQPSCLGAVSGSSFFQRGNQVWKKKSNGNILLINTKENGHHYDGDAHLFLNTKQFNQDGATEITEQEWKLIRDAHLSRLRRF